mmetsp:Transcript_113555/g.331811  ORF Transcript_113555/g.331811 Transcript_113555/m.331811 type:complete len:244 (-) Transcript_113555:468-1199(-)
MASSARRISSTSMGNFFITIAMFCATRLSSNDKTPCLESKCCLIRNARSVLLLGVKTSCSHSTAALVLSGHTSSLLLASVPSASELLPGLLSSIVEKTVSSRLMSPVMGFSCTLLPKGKYLALALGTARCCALALGGGGPFGAAFGGGGGAGGAALALGLGGSKGACTGGWAEALGAFALVPGVAGKGAVAGGGAGAGSGTWASTCCAASCAACCSADTSMPRSAMSAAWTPRSCEEWPASCR